MKKQKISVICVLVFLLFIGACFISVLNVKKTTVTRVIRNTLVYDSKRKVYTITDTKGFTYILSGNEVLFKKYENKYVEVKGDYLNVVETVAINNNLKVRDIRLINKTGK